MTRKKKMLWNEENVKAFDALYEQGLSEGKIANAMNVTGSVIHARVESIRTNDPVRHAQHIERQKANQFWHPERIELLRSLVAEGVSATAIASQLGCSKNAIVGKRHALGLTIKNGHIAPKKMGRPKAPAAPPPKKAARRSAIIFGEHQGLPPDPDKEAVSVFKSELSAELFEIGTRRTIESLTNETCRFPVGDPGTSEFAFCGRNGVDEFFCATGEHYDGADLAAGRPYCVRCSSYAFDGLTRRARSLSTYRPRFSQPRL